jgi:hypothetical protein
MNDAGTDTAPRPALGVEDEDTLPRTEALDSTAVETEELPETPGSVQPADAPDFTDQAAAVNAPAAADDANDNGDRHDGLK